MVWVAMTPSKVKITFNHNTCYNLSDPLNGKPKEILGNAGGTGNHDHQE